MDVKEGESDDDSSIDKDESIEEDRDDDDENSTSSPTKSNNKKPKYNVMGENNDNMDNLNMAKPYPYLAQALGGEDGFDPMNPSVQKSMHCSLTELNHLLSTTYELNVGAISNNKIS